MKEKLIDSGRFVLLILVREGMVALSSPTSYKQSDGRLFLLEANRNQYRACSNVHCTARLAPFECGQFSLSPSDQKDDLLLGGQIQASSSTIRCMRQQREERLELDRRKVFLLAVVPIVYIGDGSCPSKWGRSFGLL